MLTFLGIAAIVFAVVVSFIQPMLGQNSPLRFFTGRRALSVGLLGVLFVVADASFFIARESKQYYILNKANGNRSAEMTLGYILSHHSLQKFVSGINTLRLKVLKQIKKAILQFLIKRKKLQKMLKVLFVVVYQFVLLIK